MGKYKKVNYGETENYQPINDSYEDENEYEKYDENNAADYVEQSQRAESEVSETVMKSIGGGAVPITPPSQIIQLQPIVVPIAIVPFSSQNQKVVQYGGAENAIDNSANVPTNTDTANLYSYAAQNKSVNRKKSLVIMIFSLLFLLPFVIAYFKADIIAAFPLSDLNVIGKILYYIGGAQFVIGGEIVFLLLAIALCVALICFIASIISVAIGKYSKIGMLVLSLFPALFAIGAAAYAFVPSFGFIAWNKNAFIIPAAIGVVQTIISAAFAIGRKD